MSQSIYWWQGELEEAGEWQPGRCAGCGNGLFGAEMIATERRRQVIDLPADIQAVVTEHRLVSRRCGCGTVTSGTAPAGVTAQARPCL